MGVSGFLRRLQGRVRGSQVVREVFWGQLRGYHEFLEVRRDSDGASEQFHGFKGVREVYSHISSEELA